MVPLQGNVRRMKSFTRFFSKNRGSGEGRALSQAPACRTSEAVHSFATDNEALRSTQKNNPQKAFFDSIKRRGRCTTARGVLLLQGVPIVGDRVSVYIVQLDKAAVFRYNDGKRFLAVNVDYLCLLAVIDFNLCHLGIVHRKERGFAMVFERVCRDVFVYSRQAFTVTER